MSYPLARILYLISVTALLFSCGGSKPPESAAETGQVEMNAPLRAFSQDIQSSSKSLAMKPSGQVMVPVTVHNTSQDSWSSTGKYPVNVSYRWFDDGKILSLEGERTPLPGPVKPDQSVPVQVKVVAPASGKALVLKVSLVQEGVSWFFSAGAKPLEIPVTLQ